MMRNPKPHTQQPHTYLELGGGSAAKSKIDLQWMRDELRIRCMLLLDHRKREDATLVHQVLTSGFSQTRSPFHAYVTEPQMKALSRAFRVEALGLEGTERALAMLGVGNKDFQRFKAIIVRSKRLQMAQKDFATQQWNRHHGQD